MTSTPAIDRLIDDIRLRMTRGRLSEFEVAMYTKRAKQLITTDPARGFCSLGMLAAERGNEEEARKNHMKSLEVSSNDPRLQFNYACSLGILGFHEEAIEIVLKVIESEESNLEFLNDIIWLTYETNDDRLPYLLDLWKERTQGEQHPVVEEIEDAEDVRAALDSVKVEGTVSWEQIKTECNLQ